MTKLLSEFKVGEQGKIVLVTAEGRIRRRLFDMGVTAGATVLLRKKAPLGDPYEINIRGYELTLRKSEAACVVMEEDEKCDGQTSATDCQSYSANSNDQTGKECATDSADNGGKEKAVADGKGNTADCKRCRKNNKEVQQ